jgi:hypothetical protein
MRQFHVLRRGRVLSVYEGEDEAIEQARRLAPEELMTPVFVTETVAVVTSTGGDKPAITRWPKD